MDEMLDTVSRLADARIATVLVGGPGVGKRTIVRAMVGPANRGGEDVDDRVRRPRR